MQLKRARDRSKVREYLGKITLETKPCLRNPCENRKCKKQFQYFTILLPLTQSYPHDIVGVDRKKTMAVSGNISKLVMVSKP